VRGVVAARVRSLNNHPVNAAGQFVLYWMAAFRRTRWNFALQQAATWAKDLAKPLLVLETLSCGHRWDSERLHRFVLDGMADNARAFRSTAARYYPYVAPERHRANELVAALGQRACVVVTDDFPTHQIPEALATTTSDLGVRAEAVDSNGLLPLRAAHRIFPSAYVFRRFLQSELRGHLGDFPKKTALARLKLPRLKRLPAAIGRRWPMATERSLRGQPDALRALPIDHSVSAVEARGGADAAQSALRQFLRDRLPEYAKHRNEPEREVTSGLSPHLHYGHISAHQVFAELMALEGWSPGDLSPKATGSRVGWWGVGEPAEAFLDQLVTWRELGYNMCWQGTDYHRYRSLPAWARQTLAEHSSDMRPYMYSLDQLEQAETHDPLWNAAQMQLVREGRLHNYLRMLWGKKILEWSPTPQAALGAMIELNNKYALDGQDPNSYSGIFWIVGRYDRPWGPERPIFGKIRYMSSENTARKVRVAEYVRKYAP
jgi:deoxyribodipyrimidine photo-lyase